jgi:hypothetical protein
MKREVKNSNICVRITEKENKMVEFLRDSCCVNISKFIRKFIRDTYEEKAIGKHEKI